MHLNKPYYRRGVPFNIEQVSVEGVTIKAIFLRWAKKPTPEDEAILKAYVIYFMKAPHFYISALQNTDLEALTFYELIDTCFDLDLDPL